MLLTSRLSSDVKFPRSTSTPVKGSIASFMLLARYLKQSHGNDPDVGFGFTLFSIVMFAIMEITHFRNCKRERESASILISLCLNFVCSFLIFECIINSTGKIIGTKKNFEVG